MLHEETGACALKTGSCAGDRKILTRRAATDDVNRGQNRAVQLDDVPDVDHVRKPNIRDLNGKDLDFACPHWNNSVANGSQRETSDPIEEASHRQHDYTIVR